MDIARYDSAGVYTSPDGKCVNFIRGTYHARRDADPLKRGSIVKLDTDNTVFWSKPFDIGTDLHTFCVRRAVNGTPVALFPLQFDVPLVEALPDDPEPVVEIRRALSNRLIVELSTRQDAESAPLNRWFHPDAGIRGPVAALLVYGYSSNTL